MENLVSTALVWLRRDLRLHDNPALTHALETHTQVIPVYIHAPPEEEVAAGAACRWWLHQSLEALDKALQRQGSRLLLASGPSLDTLQRLIQHTDAMAVYWNRLYEPASIARDRTIKAALRQGGVQAQSFNGALLWEPWTIRNGADHPYRVFAPFWKACLRLPPAPPLPAPSRLPPLPRDIESLPLEALELLPRVRWYDTLASTWRPGESQGLAQLAFFCEHGLAHYHDGRDRPGNPGVSRLSPRLHWGELSPRQVWQAVVNQTAGAPFDDPGAAAYLRQLGWREFAHYVLYHWPHTVNAPMDLRFDAYPWRDDYRDLLQAWQQGRTGYPLVDAGMRELWQTGWMHNRVRLVVASFLTKNCRIPWQAGAAWFWDTLVDADLANNTLGWQWTAGCGVDAAPYYRVFNPVRQGQQLDPEGRYVRRWVSELAALPDKWLHCPWQLPTIEREKYGPLDYPAPVVDLAQSRAEALAGYQHVKSRRMVEFR